MATSKDVQAAIETMLDANERSLVAATLVTAFGGNGALPVASPLDDVLEDRRDELRDWLTSMMPRDTLFLNLWDWDIHFEQDLGDDWLQDAALGPDESLDDVSIVLADYYLAKVEEYDIEAGEGNAQSSFELVREESERFVRSWREAIRCACLPQCLRRRARRSDGT